MMKHIKAHATSGHRCFVCFKMFPTQAQCTKHQDEAHAMLKSSLSSENSLRTCIFCKKCFKSQLDYLEHRKSCFNSLSSSRKSKKFKVKRLKIGATIRKRSIFLAKAFCSWSNNYCMECIRGFKDGKEFQQHIKTKACPYLGDKGECMLCKATFHSLEKLKIHVTNCFKESFTSFLEPGSKSGGIDDGSNNTRAVRHCSRCNRMFPSLFTFNKHKVLFHSKKSILYKCHMCSFQCHSRSWFSSHIKKKSCPKVEKLPCFYCDYRRRTYQPFDSLNQLVSHFNAMHKPHKPATMKPHSNVATLEIPIVKDGKKEKQYLMFSPEDVEKLKGKSTICFIEGFGEFQVACKPMDGRYQIIIHKKSSPIEPTKDSLHSRVNKKDDSTAREQDEDVPLKCFACSQLLTKGPLVLEHFKKQHFYRSPQVRTCDVCHVVFGDTEFFKTHTVYAHSDYFSKDETSFTNAELEKEDWNSLYVCTHCDLPFLRTDDLSKHEEKCHGVSQLENIAYRSKHIDWPCCYCEERSIENIYTHALKHCTKKLECFQCNVKVTNLESLKHHLNQSHCDKWSEVDQQWIEQVIFDNIQSTMREMYRQRNHSQVMPCESKYILNYIHVLKKLAQIIWIRFFTRRNISREAELNNRCLSYKRNQSV